MTTRRNQSSLRGRGQLTPRERATTEANLSLDKNRSPKGCFRNMSTGGDNIIASNIYSIELGVTLSIDVDDELVVI